MPPPSPDKDPSNWTSWEQGWPDFVDIVTEDMMRQWKAVDRWFCRWFGVGEEAYEAQTVFRKLVGLNHYWASWRNGSANPTLISSFILWSIKSDKYLKPRELAILLNIFTDVLGYDHEYEVDEHEPYGHQKSSRTFRRTGRRAKDYLESYNLTSPVFNNPMHNPVPSGHGPQKSRRTDNEAGESRPLTRAEIRRRRTRALGNR